MMSPLISMNDHIHSDYTARLIDNEECLFRNEPHVRLNPASTKR